jgi:hypothetical protein
VTLFYLVVAVLVVVVVAVYVSWRAGRLDRLHHRTDGARTGLDLALVRRSSAAYELASSGLLDPATSLLLADAARRTTENGPQGDVFGRELAESDLSRALRAAFTQPEFRPSLKGNEGAEELVAGVEAAARQVFLSRKFYNDIVARTLEARRRPLVQVFRLAGHAGQPVFFEMDDGLPDE